MTGFVLGHGLVAAGAAVALLGSLALLEWFRERDERNSK